MNKFVVTALWIAWCAVHSILITSFVVVFVKDRLPGLVRYYRLFYNGLSLMTLLLLIDFTRKQGGEITFAWQGWGELLRMLLMAGALLLFWLGAKRYDLRSFLGIKQFSDGGSQVLLSADQDFLPIGVFNLTRHPWYLGSLLWIWTILDEYPRAIFVAAGILSLYLVVGTLLEERKIVREYGDKYRRYQEQVSMIFPWKWLKKRLKL